MAGATRAEKAATRAMAQQAEGATTLLTSRPLFCLLLLLLSVCCLSGRHADFVKHKLAFGDVCGAAWEELIGEIMRAAEHVQCNISHLQIKDRESAFEKRSQSVLPSNSNGQDMQKCKGKSLTTFGRYT